MQDHGQLRVQGLSTPSIITVPLRKSMKDADYKQKEEKLVDVINRLARIMLEHGPVGASTICWGFQRPWMSEL